MRIVVCGCILALLSFVGSPVTMAADPAFQIARDIANSVTFISVFDSAEESIAAVTVATDLPIYTEDGTAYQVPIRLLGGLRDHLAISESPDAPAALSWALSHMGSYASTPTASIPSNVYELIPIVVGETSTWCGDWIGLKKDCKGTCDGPKTTCTGCACKGTSTSIAPL